MRTETNLYKNVKVTEAKAKYDSSCKQLLSEKCILAQIMKACVVEFKDVDVKDIAEKYIEGTPQASEIPVAPDYEASPVIAGMSETDKTVNEGTVTFDIGSMRWLRNLAN